MNLFNLCKYKTGIQSMKKSSNKVSRRKFFNTATTKVTGLAVAAGLLGSQKANAHAVEINAVSPTPEQVEKFLALPDRPIVMVNMLKFKPNGGAAEYARYSARVQPIVESLGGKILFSSQTATCLIGNGDWDAIALVQYPRPAALIQMSRSPEYQAIAKYRLDGLEGQVNYAVLQN